MVGGQTGAGAQRAINSAAGAPYSPPASGTRPALAYLSSRRSFFCSRMRSQMMSVMAPNSIAQVRVPFAISWIRTSGGSASSSHVASRTFCSISAFSSRSWRRLASVNGLLVLDNQPIPPGRTREPAHTAGKEGWQSAQDATDKQSAEPHNSRCGPRDDVLLPHNSRRVPPRQCAAAMSRRRPLTDSQPRLTSPTEDGGGPRPFCSRTPLRNVLSYFMSVYFGARFDRLGPRHHTPFSLNLLELRNRENTPESGLQTIGGATVIVGL